jgi:hypothetical protein
MTEPLPNCFSIWDSAAASALAFSTLDLESSMNCPVGESMTDRVWMGIRVRASTGLNEIDEKVSHGTTV